MITDLTRNMEVFPELYTQRLKLRQISVDDISSLVKYANNKKIAGHIINITYPYQEPDAVFRISYVVQGFKKRERYVFAIILLDGEEFIGEISLHLDKQRNIAQLGYWIGEPFWDKGITTEATAAILDFGFKKLNLDTIFAECHIENIASEKVLLKNRMKKLGGSGSVFQYRMEKQEFEKR
jgi:ribosomal-protein-alanine N-acetyltransferase